MGVYPFSAFNTVMAEALSDARKGDVVKVMSGDAIQLVNVYRADKPSKHYKVATVSYPVEASAATLRDVHNQASTFAVNAKGSAAAFNEAASKAAVTPRIATLNMGDRSVRGLEGSREVARWPTARTRATCRRFSRSARTMSWRCSRRLTTTSTLR